MIKLKTIILIFCYVLITRPDCYGQYQDSIKLRSQLNDTTLSNDERIKAFSKLVKETLLVDTLSTDDFINSLIDRKESFTNIQLQKIRLIYEGSRSNHAQVVLIRENILAEHCSQNDSLFIYNTASQYYNRNGYYQKSVENIIASITMCEKMGYTGMKAYALSNLGKIYLKQKNYSSALNYFSKSYQIYNGLKKEYLKHSMLNNIGLVYSRQGKPDDALVYFFKVRKYIESQMIDSLSIEKYYFFYGLVGGNIAQVYITSKQYEKAIPLLIEDLEKSIKSNKRKSICVTSSALGNAYLQIGNYSAAKKYLDNAFSIVSMSDYRNVRKDILKNYAAYYKSIGNFEKSLSLTESYYLLNDSLQEELMKSGTIKLQTQFDLKNIETDLKLVEASNEKNLLKLDAKQNQFVTSLGVIIIFIILLIYFYKNQLIKSKRNKELENKNIEIEEKSIELEKTLKDKQVLLKEVHHRVKNNLQMISSLLRLQANDMEDVNVSQAIEESISRINSMSLIHQKIYLKENFHTINLKLYFESLVEEVSRSFSNMRTEIKLETEISEINLSIDNAVPIGLIVNELVINSCKYAFSDKKEGEIFVRINKKDSQVNIFIKDNGRGLPENYKEEIDSSFGSTLINLLVEQIEGNINYYNDNGAVFEIEFTDSL